MLRQGYKSIYYLEQRCKEVLTESGFASPVVFCDNCDIQWPSEDIIDVVLFGSAFKDIMQSHYWPKKSSYRFWVLSNQMGKNLKKYLNIEAGQFNRYQITPSSKEIIPLPLNNEKISFVFSSRPAILKNLDLIYLVLSNLKEQYKFNIDLHICGPHFQKQSFEKKINPIKTNLELIWKEDLGFNWAKSYKQEKNSILINFNTDPLDDYCVSMAQWQQYGLPILSGDIGPYSELTGSNIIQIDSSLFLDYRYNPSQAIINKICHEIVNKWESPVTKTSKKFERTIPKAISHKEILDSINALNSEIKNNLFNLNCYELNPMLREILL